MWIRIEPVREFWVDRIFPMKREIFGLIRGVTMASAGCSLNTEEKGSGGVTLSLLFNTTQNFPDYWHFSQQHDAARRARECERREAGVSTRESGMSWVTEIPVMTSFTLTALSNHADDDLMRRYQDMLTLLRTAERRYQSSYLISPRILKLWKELIKWERLILLWCFYIFSEVIWESSEVKYKVMGATWARTRLWLMTKYF